MVYYLTSNLDLDTNIVPPMPLLHSLKEFINRLTPVKLYVVYLLTLASTSTFDVLPHKTLLKKLYSYGIRGNVYDWFESYLSERSQYVEFQTPQSDTKPITIGVPRGSILGPILFTIDINDFSRASDKLFSILYADDTSVFIEGYEYDK